ncbi:MAG: imidazolonepropionase [Bacteroidales bacterium]|nr:imidazolonepropionase [Bacteroidales bacterium]
MDLIIRNIGFIAGTETLPAEYKAGRNMSELGIVRNGYIIVKDGLISGWGRMEEMPSLQEGGYRIIDADGRCVMPAFCDSHTHLVHAGSREQEFVDKIKGLSYEDIARRGGGILNSARLLHETPEEELYRQSVMRINEIIAQGTGAVEIKSGYGLNNEDELKMLRVIRKIKETSPLEVKATFLGAHAIPEEYVSERQRYIELIINEMIPAVADEKLAEYIDVFCDTGFFTAEETDKILKAAREYGLIPKIHANELGFSGGVRAGVINRALSVDHLERTGDEDIEILKGSGTMPTILPGSAFFLGLPDPPVRRMIDAGLPVAIASDYNPGSCPSGNMKLAVSIACIKFKMTPEEAINAATVNSAYAMGLSKTHGSVATGKVASLIITKPVPSVSYIPYAFGSDLVDTVIIKGTIIQKS